jgi:hypothetical protein
MADTIIRLLPLWEHLQISTLGSDGDIYYLPITEGNILGERKAKKKSRELFTYFISIDNCPLYNKCLTL